MAIVAKAKAGSRLVHPEGAYPAICIDVIDLGDVETHFKGKKKIQHKIVIRWFCGQFGELENEEGIKEVVPLWAGERFTLSLSDRSALRPFLEAWRGRPFTELELKGFDLESLVGAAAYLQITHNKKDETTYANVTACMKLPKEMKKPAAPDGYVRVCNRPKDGEPTREPGEDDDSDPLPF